VLVFSILTGPGWKISMVTAIGEKGGLGEMRFLICDYWWFQIINQFCQTIARFKACIT
jgi:hypothetical protein